jgi:hypothetical protein
MHRRCEPVGSFWPPAGISPLAGPACVYIAIGPAPVALMNGPGPRVAQGGSDVRPIQANGACDEAPGSSVARPSWSEPRDGLARRLRPRPWSLLRCIARKRSVTASGGKMKMNSEVLTSITMHCRGHTNNRLEAACADRPGPLDCFPEQGDPRAHRLAVPLWAPKHSNRGR